jgi:hypothetical protein
MSTTDEYKHFGKLTPSEKKEIMQNLSKKFPQHTVVSLGYWRFKATKRYQENEVSFTKDEMLLDKNGEIIPTNPEYHNIYDFARGVAVVCIKRNREFIDTEYGFRVKEDTQEGLINVDGKEVLPCNYDSIHTHLDGFVKISKDGVHKATNVITILNGNFNWGEAIPWH